MQKVNIHSTWFSHKKTQEVIFLFISRLSFLLDNQDADKKRKKKSKDVVSFNGFRDNSNDAFIHSGDLD